MLPSAAEQRVRTPLVKSSGSGSWVIAGYSVDYALDWMLVVVTGVVLAASEAGIPREGELHHGLHFGKKAVWGAGVSKSTDKW
jgi:hypothetical protein